MQRPRITATSGNPWMVIVSIASNMRTQFWRAQNASWVRALGHHAAFMPVVESDVEPCVRCGRAMDNRLRTKRGAKVYTDGYQCAQQRPLQAIRMAIERYHGATWFLIVDDDTWVDALVLRELLVRIEGWKRRPMAIGCVYANDADRYVINRTSRLRSTQMVLGGAGYLLQGPAARRLLHVKRRPKPMLTFPTSTSLTPAQPQRPPPTPVAAAPRVIDECVDSILHGPWCWWNSDWAVSECMGMVGIKPVHHWGFRQWAHQCDRTLSLTCHHVHSEEMAVMTHERAAYHRQEPSNAARWLGRVNGTTHEYHLSFRYEWVSALTTEQPLIGGVDPMKG